MAESPWPVIHAERDALATDLDGLDQAGWDTPSLCAPWTVRRALGHMTATARMTPPEIQRETTGTPAGDGVARLRARMTTSA